MYKIIQIYFKTEHKLPPKVNVQRLQPVLATNNYHTGILIFWLFVIKQKQIEV